MLNIAGVIGFIAWLEIAISHYRFRMAFAKQGRDLKELKYKAKWFPFGPLFAIALCFIVILGQNYNALFGGTIDWYGVAVSYIGIPIFLAIYLGYKFSKHTKVIALEEVNLSKNPH